MPMLKSRVILVLFISASLIGTPALAVEEPPFHTVIHEGNFEIRDYPALVVAEVIVSGNQSEAANKGFRLLAGYIFGGNKRGQSIAMTAPVSQASTGENIPLTTPVATTNDGWVVRFTMPSALTLERLPEPTNPNVHLRVISQGRFAVLEFSGIARISTVATKAKELDALVRAHRLRSVGPTWLAQYDPPWTLWFLRRNEVMISLES